MLLRRLGIAVTFAALWRLPLAHAERATPPPTWIAELPTVEAVRRSAPRGADAEDSALRLSATHVVLQDLIELFRGESPSQLLEASRTDPEVQRYFEYGAASVIGNLQGRMRNDVLAYSDAAEFRKSALARFLSPASQRAYWNVRTKTMAENLAQTDAVTDAAGVRSAMLEQLPPPAIVRRDMAGIRERDTSARTLGAFRWLTKTARSFPGGETKADEYERAATAIDATHFDWCKDEPGCDAAGEVFSRFQYCRLAYLQSGQFDGLLDDVYLPASRQSAALIQARKTKGADPKMAFKGFVPPSPACTTMGQYRHEYTTGDGSFAVLSSADPKGRELALLDGEAARAHHVDTSVFGVPLGAPLTLPLCSKLERVGEPSATTCLETKGDGSGSVRWGAGAVPEWAQLSAVTILKEDVLASVTITIPSWPRRPRSTINPGLVDAVVDGAQQTGYENELKNGPARVAKAQALLSRKYGPARKPVDVETFTLNSVVTHRTAEPEWILPGLHVKYRSDNFEDTLTIELSSVFKAREDSARAKEAAEPPL